MYNVPTRTQVFTNIKYTLHTAALVHCLIPTSVTQHSFFLFFWKIQDVFCTLDNTISWILVLFVSLRHVK